MKKFLLFSLFPLLLFVGACASAPPYKGCGESHPQKANLDRIIVDMRKTDLLLYSADPHLCIVDGPRLFAAMVPVKVNDRMVPYILISSRLLDRIPSKDHLRAVVAYQLATFILGNYTVEAPYGSFPHEYSIDRKTRDMLAAARVSEPEKVLFETLEWIQRDYPTLADRKEQLLHKRQ